MISENLMKRCTETLVSAYNPLEIYLFGSYAWGTPDDGSDLDYCIVIPETDEPPYQRIIRGERALFEQRIPVPTDIMVFTESEFAKQKSDPMTLASKIASQGVRL